MKKKKFHKELFDKKTFKESCIPGGIGIITLIFAVIYDLGPVIGFMAGCIIGLFLSVVVMLIKDCFRY